MLTRRPLDDRSKRRKESRHPGVLSDWTTHAAQPVRIADRIARFGASAPDGDRPDRRALHGLGRNGPGDEPYVRCQTKGAKLIVAGANSRVMDLFKVTKVDTVLPLVGTIEDAEA